MQDKEWNKKHFDMLNNCFLGKSLKQWEMYRNLPIRELPYGTGNPSTLTEAMKDEIDDYCFHDCWALLQLYFWAGSGQNKTKYHTLRARRRSWTRSIRIFRTSSTGLRRPWRRA